MFVKFRWKLSYVNKYVTAMSSAEIQKEIKEHFKNKVSARAQNFIYVRNLKKV